MGEEDIGTWEDEGGNPDPKEVLDLNEDEVTEEGEELEEQPDPEEVLQEEKAKDPDTHATPTELTHGPGGASPGVHTGGSAED